MTCLSPPLRLNNDMNSQLDITRTVFPVNQFVSWYRQDQLDLRPPFQRLDVWKLKAKSYLVDTVMRGLPLPLIILRDKAGISFEPKREVVDGQQRLTTLLSYICPEKFPVAKHFTLFKAHSPDFANYTFAQLPDPAKELVLKYEISTHILPSSIDDQQVLRIFSRLNATGTSLNGQELRNANYHGVFKTFAFELSLEYLKFWRTWKLFAEDDFARMKEVAYTSELIMRILEGTAGTSQSQLDRLYNRYDNDFPDLVEVRKRFEIVFQIIDANFSDKISNSEFSKITWFYTLFGEIHDRLFGTERKTNSQKLHSVHQHSLNSSFWKRISSVSDMIKTPSELPIDLVRAATGRTTNINTRTARADFLHTQV